MPPTCNPGAPAVAPGEPYHHVGPRGEQGRDFDFIAAFKAARDGLIDQQVRLDRRGGTPLELRLVATRLPAEAAAVARCKAHRAAQKRGSTPSEEALIAADWVVLVTSLSQESCSAQEVLALYRLRWRIELAFNRLKSVIGLKGPPGTDERSARAFILAHLLMILLLEPLLDGFEVSPHWAQDGARDEAQDGAQEQRARNEARAA